jgi:hypothetical protein
MIANDSTELPGRKAYLDDSRSLLVWCIGPDRVLYINDSCLSVESRNVCYVLIEVNGILVSEDKFCQQYERQKTKR